MKRGMTNVLIVVFAAVFLISGYYLVSYYVDAWKQQAAYKDLAAIVEQGTGVEPAFTAWEAVVLPIYEPCSM